MEKISVDPLFECDCECHKFGGLHALPCCHFCELCGKSIRIGFLEDHIKKFHPKIVEAAEVVPAVA